MRKLVIIIIAALLYTNLYAAQSTITEADGYACMGDDKSRKQAEQEAMTNAKRKAVEFALTYIKSETHIKDAQLEKDLVSAYANASVKIIQEIEKNWYKDQMSGDCFKVKIKAEVIPDEEAIKNITKNKDVADDPSAPLNVRLWTGKKEYKKGEKVKIFLKGNKPFFGRVVYKDVNGNMAQLLPNNYRTNNYFNGGTVYEIPSGEDKFELEVTPPFGEEDIALYASTSQLGDIELNNSNGIYEVKTKADDVGMQTRGVTIMQRISITGPGGAKKPEAAEFSETNIIVNTGK
jgi:hypothetical protein